MRRRGFLAALVAGTAGLAGCSELAGRRGRGSTTFGVPPVTDGDAEAAERTTTVPTTRTTVTARTPPPPPGTHLVRTTERLEYDPETLRIPVGDTVRWENPGPLRHGVTAYGELIPAGADYFASGGFDSEAAAREAWPEGHIAAGERYSHTFETAGTYEYFCIPHENAAMVGTLVVE